MKKIKAMESSDKINTMQMLGDKYGELNCFLCYFATAFYDGDKNDTDTVKRFIMEMDVESIIGTIKEGREVLALDLFPWKWIYSVCGYKSLSDVQGSSEIEKYYKWTSQIIDRLEHESKKAGKL